MRNGWTRVHSSELDPSNPVIVHHVYPNAPRTSRDYLFGGNSGPLMDLPAGYLFLCPLTHLQSGTPMGFRFPECVAYWSPDPWGLQRLSVESAQSLGFPSRVLSVHLSGHRWDNAVYAGLRQFHLGRGFDPESQEVARYLGIPLYQLLYK
ncbi:hypothetical protein C8F04DRAFT_1151066 [Mycena alexandri]|uniref:Uncharacterized protein n=1 Tax=Mycena alexandri TaxID=1745969 RepID=A0AAD6S296_9AGAR|nr:hypothetical protein C8F04DRAFT_1151066 [Mycena alexandri]